MRQLRIALAALVLFCVGVGQAEAEIVPFDFEGFNNTFNLDGLDLGGVTLSSPCGVVEIYDNRFGVGFHSSTKAIACADGILSVNPLVGVFDQPVTYVSLWGGDAGTYVEADSWELRAYDAPVGGNLVAMAASGSWNGYPYRQLEVAAEEIWRFEAVWTGKEHGIGYDDLAFIVVPEPSGLVLAALLGLLSCVSRTKKA